MHELAATQGMLATVLEHAEQAGAREVTRINLVLSETSGISEDAVRFHFEMISRGTLAGGASLTFRRLSARFRCWECGETFIAADGDDTCPECGKEGFPVPTEHEFYVESIEVE